METHIIEVTDMFNWGKFLLARFTHEEFAYESRVEVPDYPRRPLLVNLPRFKGEKWNGSSLIVFDLQTGEGARFNVDPKADVHKALDKHKVWVCPMAEPFLTWLYQQDLTDITTLPALVMIEGPKLLKGYRRDGGHVKDVLGLIAKRAADYYLFHGQAGFELLAEDVILTKAITDLAEGRL